MELSPLPETKYNIGQCHEMLGNARMAIACYEEVARQGVAEAWIRWSNLVRKGGRPDEALAILVEGMRRSQDPRIQIAHANLSLELKQKAKGQKH